MIWEPKRLYVIMKADVKRPSIRLTHKKSVWRPFVRGVNQYGLICEGDRIAVCVSGGKDSMLLTQCMLELRRVSPVRFDLEFIALDPGYDTESVKALALNAYALGVPLSVFKRDIFKFAAQDSGSPCFLCAKMRRGALYEEARKLGCNKIALGHHFDDAVETILLSILYAGQFRAMMPMVNSRNFPGMKLVRPLYLVREEEITAWAHSLEQPLLRLACPLTNSCVPTKRQEIKRILSTLREQNTQVDKNIFASFHNVDLNFVIGADRKNPSAE